MQAVAGIGDAGETLVIYERLCSPSVPRTGITDPGYNRNQVSMLLPNVRRIVPRQLCGFALRKTRPCAIQGFQDSGFVSRLPVQCFTLPLLQRLTPSTHSMKFSTVSAASLCLGLTWILSLTSVSGQTLAPIHKLPLNEPLEKYNNPPAPPRKIETSPRMVSPHGVFVSYQANVDANGNNILGRCCERTIYFC